MRLFAPWLAPFLIGYVAGLLVAGLMLGAF